MRRHHPRRHENPFQNHAIDLVLEIGIVLAAVAVSVALMALAYGAAA